MTAENPLRPPYPTRAGDRRRWGSLHGSAAALCVASAAGTHESLTVVITANSASAAALEAELGFYLNNDEGLALPLLQLPDWETLPYDYFSPHEDIISDRLRTLYQLPMLKRGILVVPVTTLLHRLAPPEYLQQNSLMLERGQKLELLAMSQRLQRSGYRNVETVYEHGEYAVRGSLLDIYPMGSRLPYRIDLFDDEIESLRTFDPDTQRTLEQIDSVRLLPAREYPLDRDGITRFRNQWHQTFDVDHRACPLYQEVSAGAAPAGIEYYLPLFFDECGTLFDYLPEQSLVFTLGDLETAANNFWEEASRRYESRRVDPERPILPPAAIFVGSDGLYGALKGYPRVDLQGPESEAAKTTEFATAPLPDLTINAQLANPLSKLENFLLASDERILFCAESAGRRETLLGLLSKIGVTPETCDSWEGFLASDARLAITVSPMDRGLVLASQGVAVITEGELFGNQIQQRRRRRQSQESADQVIKNLTELSIGAPVVHVDHGVGRYRGLQIIEVENQAQEFLVLEYANNDKLFVPVANLELISRYTGADEESAPLHRLGGEQWQKAKRKAAEKVRDVAAELLDVYARRAAKPGFSYRDPTADYEKFAQAFPFEETPDQEAAIEAVRADMFAPQPMDRLVCGDVGFGKTEVAMRAAFIAVQNNKQVAVLVPTTLLAQQHYANFKDRFADWPVTVEVLSRFRSTREVEGVLDNLRAGKVDILIGTHKLLQSGIEYQKLGLLIIDEEHRFGVRQKDQLKALRSEVDILTLTATPIPRTLNMAMSGIRDLSIISTPPARRLSVKTFVRQHDQGLVKEAITREVLRGGQVYYLHNEVKTIEKTARELQDILPEIRIAIGHGQLRERELEQVMSDFYHKRSNVLVCSTIIETGIDVPNANTIIIDRADKFGLAQLHQLRGRVGRSHHQAYAYLLTPPPKQMTKDAVKRLDAIASTVDLGAGFVLATHDMEIRGAGELLGDEQSGQIQNIGFSLYMELLDRAVKALREGKTPDVDLSQPESVDINLRVPALIPDDYLPDVHTRLIMYKRIAGAQNEEELRELQVEMIDRFGLLPPATKNLFRISEMKLRTAALGIAKLEAGGQSGRIEFAQHTSVDPLVIVKLVQTQPQNFQLSGANHLKFSADMDNSEAKFDAVEQVLDLLSRKEQAA
ncbi:transcription-repair coupling factor [Gilvimarinus sp. F26214L]|uniref:transcription-repair coupling factor n=1 Tax=Gilvimarinus sp. DZF01 TaxID=3461371 RepID=UPI00404614FE